ncbi:MAG: AsmA family protein [Alphaproteobacteria bacterium]
MTKKILLAIFVIIVLTVVGGYFYINNIDWNKNKSVISESVFNATGKKVIFSGPISLSLLPYPVLQATNVKIANPNDGKEEEPLLVIKSLNTKLDFIPFLKGQINIKFISLSEPTINIIKDENGDYNWLRDIDDNTINKIRDARLVLNSLTLQNATLHYEDEITEKKVELKNLNSEIIAQNLLGPFNIDGSYIKDGQPGGFSISLGELSNRFATSLNFALSHPKSETALRFDGNFLTENNSINGDVIFSSKNLKSFIDGNFSEITLDEAYNYPLAFNFELNSNNEKTVLSNLVFEYGKSKGAASLLIPHNIEGKAIFKPTLKSEINLTEFDPSPLLFFIKDTLEEDLFYSITEFDLDASFNALKVLYNDNEASDFNFNLSIKDSVFNVDNLKVTLPEKSPLTANGSVYGNEDAILTYSVDFDFETNDLYNILSWMKIAPEKHNENVYKKAYLKTRLQGTNKQVKIMDIDAKVDQTNATGNIALSLGAINSALINIDLDKINLDNYIKKEKTDDLLTAAKNTTPYLRTSKNNEAQIRANINQLTFNEMLFEKTKIETNIYENKIDISNLNFKTFNNADVIVAGTIKDDNEKIVLENFKYKLQAENVNEFLQKLGVETTYINTEKMNGIEAEGIISGAFDNFNTKSNIKLPEINYLYFGNVKTINNETSYSGRLDLQANDFVKFINLIGIKYSPNTYSLGTFSVSANVNGKKEDFKLKDASFNIGTNKFEGSLEFKNGEKPTIVSKLNIDKFDTKRFFYNQETKRVPETIFKKPSSNITFIEEPYFNSTKINYDFYKTFNLAAELKFGELDVEGNKFNNSSFALNINNDIIDISNFSADFNKGQISGNLELAIKNEPTLNGTISLHNQSFSQELNNSISIYGLKVESFDINNVTFSTKASSIKDAFENITANIEMKLNKLDIKGFNFSEIREDLIVRDNSKDLVKMMSENLSKGTFSFPTLTQSIFIKNGDFNFKTKFKGKTENVETTTTGSLKKWNINFDAVAELFQDNFLPKYSFNINGGLDNPKLTVNAEELITMFDERELEFNKQRQMREEEAKLQLKQRMDSIQAIAKATEQELSALIENEIKIKQADATENLKNNYKEALNSAKELSTEVDDLLLQSSAIDISEEELTQFENKNKELKNKVLKIKRKTDDIYMEDTKKKISTAFNDFSKKKEDADKTYNSNIKKYEDTLNKFNDIETSYNIEKDMQIKTIENNVNEAYKMADNIYAEVKTSYDNSKNNKNIVMLESLIKNIDDHGENMQEYIKTFIILQKEKLNYITRIYDEENRIYTEKKEEEKRQAEIEEKIKENTGSISIEDKGNVTIQRNIKEIELEETKVKDDNIKVLDFSTPKTTQEKITPSKTEGSIIIHN